jgi:hypothetical protein
MRFLNVLLPLAVSLALAAPASAAQSPADVAGAPTAGSNQEGVIELGKISPNGPYRLWSAINKVLLEYASLKGGEELGSQVQGVYAGQFDGMTPADVLTQAAEFRGTLDQVLDRLKLPKVEIYKDPLGRKVTPGVVFVNAGNIMDAVVAAFHSASNSPDSSLGDLYDVPVSTGKTPSDVYALVYLATTRLQVITAF